MGQIKKGITLSYVLILINNAIRLTYTPFLIRSLGQSEYGLYALAVSTVGYLSIMDLGLGNAMIRYTAKYLSLKDYKTLNGLHGMFLMIYALIGIIVAILGYVFYLNANYFFQDSMSVLELEKIKILILLLTFNLAITFPFSIFNSVIIAHERFVFSRLLSILGVLLNPILMTPFLLMGYKSITLVLVITGINLLTLIANYIYCKKKINISPTYFYFNKPLFKQILGYSFYVFLNAIVDQIYWNSGQFILGSLSGAKSVAIYSVAITLKNLYFAMSTSIVGLMLPRVTKMITDKVSNSELTKMFVKIGRLQYILLSAILIGFTFFGKEFIILWVGEKYNESFFIALWIMIPLTIPLIQNLGITILQAKNEQKFRSICYFIIAVVNISFAIPAARAYGGLGCAIVTGFSLLIGNGIIMNIYYHKKIRLNMILFWTEILKLSIPLILTVAIYLMFKLFFSHENSLIEYFISICVFVLLFLISMWFVGMNGYEKRIIERVFKK